MNSDQGGANPSAANSVAGNPDYVLGHSDHELNRLRAQARLLEPVTRQFLREAGIAPGMHVLDVGSGAGEVAFLAAELVGETGSVLGTDRVPSAVAIATQAARERGLHNVQFRAGDPAELTFERRFDAVVGRYVLPFQADPSAMLRGLARHLVPDGLLVFHEPDWTCVRSFPPAPLYDEACRWVDETTRLTGQSWNFLDRAHAAFAAADLPAPTMRMHTFLAGASQTHEWLMAVADIVESLLPTIIEQGVATAEDIDLATFRERLCAEVTANDSVIVGRSEIGIWTTAPPATDC
ncbi:MAG: class I SAM-dependent methyltransferase [Planctomycetales bacterium]|nr:class I SAM-dependent methyltransferase [Planctomycetales bacterium]